MRSESWLRNWGIIVLLQLLSFFFIVFPILVGTYAIEPILVGIISELAIFLVVIFGKRRLWFFIGWDIQLFTAVLLSVLFNFRSTFQISKDPSPMTIGLFVFILVFIEIIVVVFLLFKEKAIRKILAVCAFSTAIIVILIVGFIFNEGMPTFLREDPVKFITNPKWVPTSAPSNDYSEDLMMEVGSADIHVDISDYNISIPLNMNRTLDVVITNAGNAPQLYNITFSTGPGLRVELQYNQSPFNPGEPRHISIGLNANRTGVFPLNLKIMAENEESRVLAFSVKVLESGIIFFPSNAKLFQDGPSGEYERPVIRCENVGSDAKSFIITADGPDLFNPFLSGADLRWNYSTHSTIITMSGWENRTYTFNPNLIAYSDSYVGEYDIFLNATSLSDPDIISSFRLHFTIGIKMRLFSLNEHELFIPPGENRSVEISLSNVSGRVLDLKLKGLPAGFVAQLYDSESNLISGNSHWALKRGQNASLDYLLVITAQANGTYGQQFSMRLTLHDPGTQPSFGIYPFIIGSFSVVALTLVMAAPLGIGCAIFFSEFSPPRIRKLLLPVFELLAGIPSVVYGMWGFLVFGPFLAKTVFPFFGRQSIWGESILTASIVLTIMVLPIIVTLSYDAMRNVKKELREGSYAVGVTKWGTAIRVVLPTAKSGIASSVILAMGRAIGETMAVVMIMGPVTTVPHSLLDPAGTMPSIIAGVLGWGFSDDYIRQALFAIASILFLIIFVLNSIVFRLQGEQKTGGSSAFRRIRKKIGQLFRSREGVGIPVVTARDNIGTRKIKQVGNHNNVLDDIRRMFKPSKSAIRGQKMAVGVLVGCVIFVIIMLSMILQDVLFVGITSFRIDFLVNKESTLTSATGGFLNAIIGSLLLVGIALALAVPLSLGAAIYINEYIKKGDRMSRTVLFASDTLASTPSIVFGAFGFLFFVLYFRLGFSLLAGGLTLGFMIIPLLLRSSLESLKSVPNDYREASHSLGASQWQTIRNAVLPPAMPMITSGIIIGIGRAIGETAAVIFTAGYTAHVVDSLLLPAASMPNMIYLYFSFSAIYPVLKAKVYSCALVLLLMVLSLNITARYIQSRTTKGKGTL